MTSKTFGQALYDEIWMNGGLSYNPIEETPKTGYMVGILVLDEFEPEGLKETEVHKRISEAYCKYYNYRFDLHDRFFGGWLSEGILYLDISEHVENREDAIALAKARGELAIYDIANDKSIFVDKIRKVNNP